MWESRKTLKELYIGTGIVILPFMIIGLIFARPVWIYEVALLVGGIVSCLLMYNVYDSLDRALDMGAVGARKFVMVRALIRLFIKVFLLVGSIMIDILAFVGVAIGLVAVKLSAYINPLIKKYTKGK